MACQKKIEIKQEILDAKLLSNEREELSIRQPRNDCMSVKLYVYKKKVRIGEENKKKKITFLTSNKS